MSASKLSFSQQLRKIAKKQMSEVDGNICNIARDLFHSIADLTPVGKTEYVTAGGKVWHNIPGELVNNWQPAVNYIKTKLQAVPGPKREGIHKRIDTTIINGSFKKDGFVSFTNITPYVNLAENVGWLPPRWSGRTGPYGMVKNSIAMILSKYGY